MSQTEVFSIVQGAMVLALELSLPILSCALIVGVVVSIFQAITQINDSTLGLVPKIIAVFAAVGVCGPWMFHTMLRFTVSMLSAGATMVR